MAHKNLYNTSQAPSYVQWHSGHLYEIQKKELFSIVYGNVLKFRNSGKMFVWSV